MFETIKSGKVHSGKDLSSCPVTMVKNDKLYIGTVSHGKARILQAPGSDVSLEIPKGSIGVYVMAVHTNVSTYKNCVEDIECFVSPVVEIEHRRTENDTTDELLKPHTLKIPHCLRDRALLQAIKVRRGKLSSYVPFQEIPSLDEIHSMDHCYLVDDNSITISTSKFSEFICTTCSTTCQGTIQLFKYGRLKPWPDKDVSTVQMKSFLCSPLFRISEFRDVSRFKDNNSSNIN